MKSLRWWLALVVLMVSCAAHSQQPIRINIGFVAGSAPDILARLISERMRDSLGRVVLVDNKPGAAGRIAVDATRSAAPDGSTLMMVPNGPMTLFPWVFKGLGFDPVRDFTPLSLVTLSELVLSVGPVTPARTVAVQIPARQISVRAVPARFFTLRASPSRRRSVCRCSTSRTRDRCSR